MYYLYLVYYEYCLNNLISLNFNITYIEIHILYTYQVLLENNIFTAVKVRKVLLRIKLVLQPILIMYIYQTGMPNVGIVVWLGRLATERAETEWEVSKEDAWTDNPEIPVVWELLLNSLIVLNRYLLLFMCILVISILIFNIGNSFWLKRVLS